MLIVEFDGLLSWSLDASETGKSTKCLWVVATALIKSINSLLPWKKPVKWGKYDMITCYCEFGNILKVTKSSRMNAGRKNSSLIPKKATESSENSNFSDACHLWGNKYILPENLYNPFTTRADYCYYTPSGIANQNAGFALVHWLGDTNIWCNFDVSYLLQLSYLVIKTKILIIWCN